MKFLHFPLFSVVSQQDSWFSRNNICTSHLVNVSGYRDPDPNVTIAKTDKRSLTKPEMF